MSPQGSRLATSKNSCVRQTRGRVGSTVRFVYIRPSKAHVLRTPPPTRNTELSDLLGAGFRPRQFLVVARRHGAEWPSSGRGARSLPSNRREEPRAAGASAERGIRRAIEAAAGRVARRCASRRRSRAERSRRVGWPSWTPFEPCPVRGASATIRLQGEPTEVN